MINNAITALFQAKYRKDPLIFKLQIDVYVSDKPVRWESVKKKLQGSELNQCANTAQA